MDNGLFERLKQEPSDAEQTAGLRMRDMLALPDVLCTLMGWMLRRNTVRLHDIMVWLGQDEIATRSITAVLVEKGFVRPGTQGETNYKVRMTSTNSSRHA